MKKIIALALAAAMLTSCLTGCGGEKNSDPNSDNEKINAETQENETASSKEKIDYTKYPVTPAEYFEYTEKTKAELEDSFHIKLDTTAETCIVIEKYRNENNDIEVVVVPPEIHGKPVVGIIGNSTFYFVNGVQGDNNIKAIVLPDTVEVIAGGFAFSMDNLETVHLGNGLKCLGYEYVYDNKFLFNCPKVEELIFPESLEKIGDIGIFLCGPKHALKRIYFPKGVVGQHASLNDVWGKNVTESELIVECESDSYIAIRCDEEYIMTQNHEGTRDLENYKQNREKLSKFYDDYTDIYEGAIDRYMYINEELGIAGLMLNKEDGKTVMEDKGNGYHEGTIGGIKVFTQEIPEEITQKYNATTYEGVEKMAMDIVNHAMEEQQVGGEILDYVTIDSGHGPMTVVASGVKEEAHGTAYGKNHGDHFILWKIYGDKVIGVCDSWFILARTITPLNQVL